MHTYSRLKRLLKQQHLSVPELHRRMRKQGISVNVKSLYRLNNDSQPVDRLDMRVAGAICQVCAVPLSEWIVFEEEAEILIDKPDRTVVNGSLKMPCGIAPCLSDLSIRKPNSEGPRHTDAFRDSELSGSCRTSRLGDTELTEEKTEYRPKEEISCGG